MTDTIRHFDEGATVVRRHVHQGKVWSAVPYRVLRDTADHLVVAGWPGLRGLASTALIASLLSGGDQREQTIGTLATPST